MLSRENHMLRSKAGPRVTTIVFSKVTKLVEMDSWSLMAKKIKNDGTQKPGTDVTFDEKPKVEIIPNVFPVRDSAGNTAVV